MYFPIPHYSKLNMDKLDCDTMNTGSCVTYVLNLYIIAIAFDHFLDI